MTQVFIDPLTDFGFKRIFANEEHKNITISFLNSILKLKNPIVSIEFQNLEKGGYSDNEKKSIFDIFAKDSEDKEIIVELQRVNQTYFIDRAIFYTSKQITNMGIKGSWDYKLNPIYFIGIMDFIHFPKDEEYIRYINLKDRKCNEVYPKLEYVFIELPKFKASYENLAELEKWLYFLNNLPKLQEKQFDSNHNFQEAFEIAYFSQLKDDDRLRYEIDLKNRRDRYAIEQTQERDLAQAEERGKKEGQKEGQRKKQLEIAKGMLEKGLDLSLISELTQLSEKEILELKHIL